MRLYLLELGVIRYFKDRPVSGYLIRTADGANVLVDTGCLVDAPADMPIEVHPEHDLLTQLAEVDVRPEDIHYVVCSHLDPDHAGNHDLFGQAEFVIQSSHYELACSGRVPRLEIARKHWDHQNLSYRTVDGDVELLPGIELIESSGHILGHQSVLVRLPNTGPVLLAIDAITHEKALNADTRPMTRFDLDADAARASTRKLVGIAREENAFIMRGHDPQQWPTLKRSPEFYD